MKDVPTSQQILAATVHRDSAEIRLLAGIYDLLREIACAPHSTEERPEISWRPAKERRR